ncbi:DUF421 domain-containing protein [Brevibacterium aurantiacum]|nr:DUF421 domain-containing protein [Brevibacterium aurantiacum]
MIISDLGTTWQALVVVAISTVGIYLALILFSRIAGLRSFSQMTNFDMAATVAIGSILATTALSSSTPLLAGVVGLAVLFAIQWVLATLRRYRRPGRLVDNSPLVLMSGSDVLSEHLTIAQMTRSDLRSKLRLAGVTRYDQVGAVILEVTGDVSVLLKAPEDPPMEPDLFVSVRGRERLFSSDHFASENS